MDGDNTAGADNSLHYQSDDGLCRIACHIADNSVWLTLPQIAALHRTTEQNVAHQLKAAFSGRRLRASSMLKAPETAGGGISRHSATRYGLDAVLVVGERLGSLHGVALARWACTHLEGRPGEPPP